MHTKHLMGAALIAVAVGLSGCQAWPGANFPVQNTTRVPPPGTGTYNLPGGYYNKTSSLAPNSQQLQANNATGLRSGGGSLPTTTLTNNSFASANSSSPVLTAAHADFSGPTGEVASAGGSVRSSAAVSASLSDADANEVPSLQWQQH